MTMRDVKIRKSTGLIEEIMANIERIDAFIRAVVTATKVQVKAVMILNATKVAAHGGNHQETKSETGNRVKHTSFTKRRSERGRRSLSGLQRPNWRE